MDELWAACSEFAMADLKAYESADMSEGKKAACLEIVLVVWMANLSVAE